VPGPLVVDFLKGSFGYRLKKSKIQREHIAKAIGWKPKEKLFVIDATAGLGRDGFLLAALGCEVLMLEQSPVIGALLQDGLKRALANPLFSHLKIQLKVTEAGRYLEKLKRDNYPDVIYLDPMYPERTKSALVKKEMQYLQAIVGIDEDASQLLSIALSRAKKRVVVKRSRLAPILGKAKPQSQLIGRNTRFDIYLVIR
jgi:16S rRNA (guanine1516-N2)-methyltransferase